MKDKIQDNICATRLAITMICKHENTYTLKVIYCVINLSVHQYITIKVLYSLFTMQVLLLGLNQI